MFYAYLGIVICLVFAIYYYKKEKLIINPVTVFSVEWAVILFFSSLSLLTLYTPQDSTYMLIFYGIISFLLGYVLDRHFFSKIDRKKRTKVCYLNYNFIYFLLIATILYYVFDLYRIINTVGSFTLQNVQRVLQDGVVEYNNTPFRVLLLLFIVQPGSIVLPVVAAVDFWFGKKKKFLLVGTLIMVIIKMLASASRSTLISFIIYFIISGFISLRTGKTKIFSIASSNYYKKNKKLINSSLILGILLFEIMTLSRGSTVIRNIYLNFAMPPIMFEKWINNIADPNLMAYGQASLNGFFYLIIWPFSKLIGTNMPEFFSRVYDLIMNTDTQWQWIGDKIIANAYVSLFWFGYVDGKLIGIIIESFIFGWVNSITFRNAIKYTSQQNVAIYCMIFYSVLFSFVRMQFSMTNFVMSFIYILFFIYKNKKVSGV